MVALLALAACGGGGGSAGGESVATAAGPLPIGNVGQPAPSAAPSASALPVPSGTPAAHSTAAAVTAVPSALAFQGLTGSPQTVKIAQAQSAGFVLTTIDCGGIVAVSPTHGSGPFAFTPVQAGSCSYLVTGNGGATASVRVVITTTTVITI